MTFGNMFASLSGDTSSPPAWMSWAVWPFLALVALWSGRRRG